MHIIRNIKKLLRKLQDAIIVKELSKLNDYLADKYCEHCKESETVCLKFYPYDLKIRRIVKRVGINEQSQKK